ncbi:hypothetical protein CHU98_g4627, partial [Xylaria longipes]
MAPSTNTNEHEETIELRASTSNTNANANANANSISNSDGGDVDIDDKIHEAYDRDAGMRGDGGRDASPFNKGARKDGLQRLPSHVDDDFEDRAGSVATTEAVENAGDAAGNGGDDGAETVYKVYKRRWFGLVQLTLLNIVVSWDWLTFSPVSQYAAAYYGRSESDVNWFSTAFLFA